MKPDLENDMFFLKKVRNNEILVYEDGKVINNKTKRKLGSNPNGGYIRIGFKDYEINKIRLIQVNRLVWLAFNGPIPEGITINHKNGNKIDNRLDNLELATYSEQTLHAFKLGLNKVSDYAKEESSKRWSGENNCNSLITNEKAREIREDYNLNPRPYSKMAREYNLPRCTISSIVKGQSYKGEHIL